MAAMRAGAAPSLRAGAAGAAGLPRHAAADRLRQDDLAAVHRRGDDRPPRPAAARGGARDRHRARLPDGGPGAAVRRVWSVEIVEEFALEAEARLRRLGCGNVGIRVGDGSRGWAEHAPFDKILVTAAAEACAAGAGRADRKNRAAAPFWDTARIQPIVFETHGSRPGWKVRGATRTAGSVSSRRACSGAPRQHQPRLPELMLKNVTSIYDQQRLSGKAERPRGFRAPERRCGAGQHRHDRCRNRAGSCVRHAQR